MLRVVSGVALMMLAVATFRRSVEPLLKHLALLFLATGLFAVSAFVFVSGVWSVVAHWRRRGRSPSEQQLTEMEPEAEADVGFAAAANG